MFDFGGGTLDISILSIIKRKIEVKAVNGDTNIGGQDIDNILMHRCIEKIKEELEIDLINNSRAKARIRKCCKEAKHELTVDTEANLEIESIAHE